MLGAIIGDIAGSVWEFDSTMKSRPKTLFPEGCNFTDDSILTVAIADALLHDGKFDVAMRKWGSKYKGPKGGFGGRFLQWLSDDTMGPYYSFGNGSAMRVSPAGWVASDLKHAKMLAKKTAEVTHNHPEGIKGAQTTAGAVYLAKAGYGKDVIRDFVEGMGYDLSRTCDEIRPTYIFNESCQGTVPEAMTAFFESDSFEDCLKLGVSLGGDSDTLCAIAGGVAGAFYGIPKNIAKRCRMMLPGDMLAVIDEFEARYGNEYSR